MQISSRKPKWEHRREAHLYRVGKALRIVGRVDLIGSLGYWWQTSEMTGIAYSLQEAKWHVETAVDRKDNFTFLSATLTHQLARAA